MIPRALVFDFDGTIVDTETAEFESVSAAFASHGVEYTLDEYRSKIGRIDHQPWHELLTERAGPLPDLESVVAGKREHHLGLIAEAELRPGVIDALDRAARADVPVAVASSSPRDWVDHHLAERDLLHRFPVIATGDVVAQAKPWPDVFLLAAELLDVDPTSCLAIEDSHNGLVAAKAAGMRCLVVPNDMTVGLDFSTADWVLESLADFRWDSVGL